MDNIERPRWMLEEDEESWFAWMDEEMAAIAQQRVESRIDFFLEQIERVERREERDAEIARERIRRIEEWLESRSKRTSVRLAWLREHVRALVDQIDFEGRKSRDLPHGRIGFRVRKPSVLIVDKMRAMEWAADHCPDAIVQRSTVDLVKTPLIEAWAKGARYNADIDGIAYVEGGDDFYITTGGDL